MLSSRDREKDKKNRLDAKTAPTPELALSEARALLPIYRTFQQAGHHPKKKMVPSKVWQRVELNYTELYI